MSKKNQKKLKITYRESSLPKEEKKKRLHQAFDILLSQKDIERLKKKKQEMKKIGKEAEQILVWLTWADNDYLSARLMLLNNFLVQGTIFSNTAVEKYLKTIFLFEGWNLPRSHKVPFLYRKLDDMGHNLKLNKEYLKLINKAYELRYPDNLREGYNICLAQAKMLVELDATVYKIRKRFNFKRGNGKKVESSFDLRLSSGDKNLLEYNNFFGSTKREETFNKLDHCYELRILGNNTLLEIEYRTKDPKDNGIFNMVALKPKL